MSHPQRGQLQRARGLGAAWRVLRGRGSSSSAWGTAARREKALQDLGDPGTRCPRSRSPSVEPATQAGSNKSESFRLSCSLARSSACTHTPCSAHGGPANTSKAQYQLPWHKAGWGRSSGPASEALPALGTQRCLCGGVGPGQGAVPLQTSCFTGALGAARLCARLQLRLCDRARSYPPLPLPGQSPRKAGGLCLPEERPQRQLPRRWEAQ